MSTISTLHQLVALRLGEFEKKAFAPMAGAPPADPMAGGMPMDPAMMGGGMPMDPAMMGGGMPMDPAMMGGGMPMDPAAGGMPPMDPAAAAPPPEPGGSDPAVIADVVRNVLQEMGIGPKQQSKPKISPEEINERLGTLEAALSQIAQTVGLADPTEALVGAVQHNAQQSAAELPPEEEAAPMPIGPMDQAGNEALSNLSKPWSPYGKQASAEDSELRGEMRALFG